jgi:hypothetical protein
MKREHRFNFIKKKKGKIIAFLSALFVFITIIFVIYTPQNSQVNYGVTFSKPFAEHLGLDWKETYLAVLDDLDVKFLRLPIYWTEIEAQNNNLTFENVDWQIQEAEKKDAKIIFVLGQKQPRWPECHIPDWAREMSKEDREKELIEIISYTVEKYKNKTTISAWQIENEPFLPYGNCPILDKDFLDKEIATVRNLDPSRPIIITDSGELSTWYRAASRADILGTTLYRIVWDERVGYVHYPISSLFYRFKAAMIHYLTDVQKIIIVELQAEPWGPDIILNTPLEEQYKSMNAEQFKKNIAYVNEVEFSEAYLWGCEWWYWLKTKQNDDSIWQEAKKVF